MTKSNVTRKSALSAAIIAFDYLNFEGIQIEGIAEDYSDIKETLNNMLVQVSKPRAKAVSKARLANEGLAREIAKAIPADGITTKEIVAFGIPAVATTQKAAAVMRVAEELGLVIKVKDGKRIAYKPADDSEVA